MSIFCVVKENIHVSVAILLIFINFCQSTTKKEEDEGLLETLDKLIQQTDAGRVSTNETRAKNDSNVYYLKNNPPRIPKLKSKSSRKRLKSKSKTKRTTIATTTLKPSTDNVTENETLNETSDINKSLEKNSQIDTTTEGPSSKEQKNNKIIAPEEKTTLTSVSTEVVSTTSEPEKLSARKLLDFVNDTFDTTTSTPELNNNVYVNNVIEGEKIDENLDDELENKTEGPALASNDTLASDDTTTTQSTLDKPPVTVNTENDMSFRKALNMSEPTDKENDEDLNDLSSEKKPQTDYFPHYLDAKIENLLHEDPDNFIKLLSDNAENIKRDLSDKEPIEKLDIDKPGTPELQSEVQKLVRKILVLKSFSRNHYESVEKSNEYDKEPSEISFRRFPSTAVVQSNPPYSFNRPVSNTYYMKDSYVPVPVPVANPIINSVATLPVANNLQIHYGANALWNNNLAAMSSAHKMAHIGQVTRLINNLMGRVLYPPIFNSYVYY